MCACVAVCVCACANNNLGKIPPEENYGSLTLMKTVQKCDMRGKNSKCVFLTIVC